MTVGCWRGASIFVRSALAAAGGGRPFRRRRPPALYTETWPTWQPSTRTRLPSWPAAKSFTLAAFHNTTHAPTRSAGTRPARTESNLARRRLPRDRILNERRHVVAQRDHRLVVDVD